MPRGVDWDALYWDEYTDEQKQQAVVRAVRRRRTTQIAIRVIIGSFLMFLVVWSIAIFS